MVNNPDSLQDVTSDAADAELEQLLCDAYDVPAVPRTLLKRLDRAVEQQWGVSPGVSRQDPGWFKRSAGRAARSMKSWTAAACLMAGVALTVMFSVDSSAYGWSKMLKALSEQTVVQINTGDEQAGIRWMSVSEGLVSLRSNGGSRLFDFRRGVILERAPSETQVRRMPLLNPLDASQSDRLVIAFFLGGAAIEHNALQVIDESWSKIRHGDHDAIELKVTLGGDVADNEPLRLNIILDPKTQLPIACRVVGDDLSQNELVFSYPRTKAAELIALDFPSDLPIVDVASLTALSVDVVPNKSESRDNKRPPNQNTVAKPTNRQGTDGDEKSIKPPLVGAATLEWTPVAAVDLSPDDFLIRIDSLLAGLWRENDIEPTKQAADEELLRRVYLDLVGRTPTVNEVRAYAEQAAPDRYEALVDRLLVSRDHATHLATVWRTFLLPEGVDLTRFGGTEAFDKWLSVQFGDNVPYDELVRRLLLAEGRLSKSGPLLFYAAMKLDADQLAARSARVFLGMRLECAQCHDDPFEPWTQEDFWSYAAFFARISRPQAKLEAVSTVMRVRDIDRGEVKLPDSDTVVPPHFLDGSSVDEKPKAAARRHQLAAWLTGADNPFFARAAANRVWAHLLGRGIVDPVDGFGKQHPPISPKLLDLLAGHFVNSEFDLRSLFRTIALSRAYRLSSGSETADPNRVAWFAQMNVKTLTAEQVYDCIAVATMLVSTGNGAGFNLSRVGNSSRETFVQQFRTPAGNTTEYHGGIPQALTLMNGTLISNATGLTSSGLLKSLEAPFFTDDQRIEVIYLATMSRRPSLDEWKLLREYIKDRGPDITVQEPLADILWSLLNSAEFTMNH